MGKLKILFVVLIGLLVGCSKEAPRKTHTLRMNICREPTTMDPRQGSEQISSSMHFIMFEGLMRLNPNGSLTPAQAKSVEISDDRKTYTFHLRGTKWSDGTMVTAADFEQAWKKILSSDFPAANAPLLYPIKNGEKAKKGVVSIDEVGIRSLDEKTLVVELEQPTPYFLDVISFCTFAPVKHTVDVANPTWMREAGFVSNGPFRLAAWKHHNEIVFEKNPYYWEADQINLGQIRVTMISDETTALNMYENGELDLIGLGLSPLPTDALSKYQAALKTHSLPAMTSICFNIEKFPNKNIRKALAYAIDRKEIVENITQMGEQVATHLFPLSSSYFNDNDTKRAKELFQRGLKETGLKKEDLSLTYLYSHGEVNRKLAQIVQQQWSKTLGISIKLEHVEHKVLLDRLKTHDFDLAQSFWIAQYHDPMSILERFKSKTHPKNYPGWENDTYIKLLDKSAHETGEERWNTLHAAEALFMEEMAIAPLYHWKTAFMIKDHLTYLEYPEDGFLELTRIQYR